MFVACSANAGKTCQMLEKLQGSDYVLYWPPRTTEWLSSQHRPVLAKFLRFRTCHSSTCPPYVQVCHCTCQVIQGLVLQMTNAGDEKSWGLNRDFFSLVGFVANETMWNRIDWWVIADSSHCHNIQDVDTLNFKSSRKVCEAKQPA